MYDVDVAIVGGGIVGLSLALSLEKTGLRVLVIEQSQAPSMPTDEVLGQRVSALNLASEAFLHSLKVWQMPDLQPYMTTYHQMDVWEADSFGCIQFQAEDVIQSHLGHIVENAALRYALWQRAMQAPWIALSTQTKLTSAVLSPTHVYFNQKDGGFAQAKLAVAADGAHSWLRQQMNIPLFERDYNHCALVCAVHTQSAHAHTAYQVFRPQGPLAFLPLPGENQHAIVWSGPPESMQQLATLPCTDLARQIYVYADGRFGEIKCLQSPQVIPLCARYAKSFVGERVVLIGDCAHTIHPLAGLGMNLGLMDAAHLAQVLAHLYAHGNDIGQPSFLRAFERQRKAQAVKHLVAMQGLKTLFSCQVPGVKLLRALGLYGVDRFGSGKRRLIEEATGLTMKDKDMPWMSDYVQVP